MNDQETSIPGEIHREIRLDAHKDQVVAPGLFERNGVLYMRLRWQGRLYRQKCAYQGHAAFSARGKVLRCVEEARDVWQSSIRTGEYDQQREVPKPVAAVPTLDGLCDAYKAEAAEQYAASGSPRPGTVTGNVARLRGISKEMGVDGSGLVDRLTVEAVKAWIRGKVDLAGNNQDAEARTRYSCWRSLAVARSLWAPWARDAYLSAGIVIPDCLLAWPHPPRGAAAAPQVQIPPEELMEATLRAYEALEKANPRLWLAATLVLMLGMRPRSDGSRASWDWFHRRGDDWWLEYTPNKTRGRTTEGSAVVSIRMPAALYDRMRVANPEDGFVVAGANHQERWDVFARELCTWQRGNGWTAEKYSKPAYMLRKLCASAVARATGGNFQASATYLGISPATLMKHYAADFKQQGQSVDVAQVIQGALGKAPAEKAG